MTIEAGAFLSDFDTRLRLSGPEGGTEIALEDDLNLTDDQTSCRANLAWRFADRHTLGIGYYSFNRSDTGVLEETFGERFGAGVGYTWSDIDLDADDGAYQFKFDYRYNGLEAFLNFRF